MTENLKQACRARLKIMTTESDSFVCSSINVSPMERAAVMAQISIMQMQMLLTARNIIRISVWQTNFKYTYIHLNVIKLVNQSL